MLTGEYNKQGYKIFSDNELIYEAGNNPLDSALGQNLASDGLSLPALKMYCDITMSDLAIERNEETGDILQTK